jgi:1,4-dihydroxy-2-naphthoyl-CoA hydrolase
MTFIYHRTVRFKDTDAAGVVYFANTLTLCHEAYEESLIATGIEVQQFFRQSNWVIPIIHADVDYFRPAVCGDRQDIHLTPVRLTEHQFEICYKVYEAADPEHLVAQAHTQHICINPVNRRRQPLPQQILEWLEKWADPEN